LEDIKHLLTSGEEEGQVSTIKKISAKVDKRYEGNGGIAKVPG
jgi:hypothetical protein